MRVVNVHDDEWDGAGSRPGYASRRRGLRPLLDAEHLGATLYALEPGERICPYHLHYIDEEWLLVLDGTPTLRTPDETRILRTGDVVAFPRGPAGAHEVRNESESSVRVLMLSTRDNADVIAYPDSGKIAAVASRLGGERIGIINRPEANLDYYDGEE